MRYELSDGEWATIRPMLPNKARGVSRLDDRHDNRLAAKLLSRLTPGAMLLAGRGYDAELD
jgi:transposase